MASGPSEKEIEAARIAICKTPDVGAVCDPERAQFCLCMDYARAALSAAQKVRESEDTEDTEANIILDELAQMFRDAQSEGRATIESAVGSRFHGRVQALNR